MAAAAINFAGFSLPLKQKYINSIKKIDLVTEDLPNNYETCAGGGIWREGVGGKSGEMGGGRRRGWWGG